MFFLFWPDTPDAAARRNLAGLLGHLRRALPVPWVLAVEDERVWLDPARVWSDSCAFGHPGSRGIDLYRGPFLDGYSLPECAEFETWASPERQSWERRYLEGRRALIDEKSAHSDLAPAIDYARRYLAIDAWPRTSTSSSSSSTPPPGSGVLLCTRARSALPCWSGSWGSAPCPTWRASDRR